MHDVITRDEMLGQGYAGRRQASFSQRPTARRHNRAGMLR